MAIKYEPSKILKKMANAKSVKKILTKKVSVNRAALNAIASSEIVGGKELNKVATRVIRDYKKRIAKARKEGATKKDATAAVTAEPKQLVQRVQNATVAAITERIKDKYHGEKYRWLPSTAAEPRKEHMKYYGKVRTIGRGKMPGDDIGCQCGMEILVRETKLNLDDED